MRLAASGRRSTQARLRMYRMKAGLMGHAALLPDVDVGQGGFHPQAAAFIDAAYRG